MDGNLANRMKHLQSTDNQESITQLVNYPIFGDEIQPCVLSLDDNPKVVGYLPVVADGMVGLINSNGRLTYKKLSRFNEIGKTTYQNLGYVFLGKMDFNGYQCLNTGSKVNTTTTRYYPNGNTTAFVYTTDSTVHANALLFSVKGLVNGDFIGVGKGDYSSFSDSRKITADGTYLIRDEVLYNVPWGFKLWNTNTSGRSTVTLKLEAIFRDF